ncbi:MAG: 4-hydroxy-tetrahydrodipicolinate synthase [Firmicutes bacterium]|nr:4-hydroxy-tetrahydrodipicolinate synthase [Bacillota bacterium]
MSDFGVVLTAMVTPFKEDGKVNYEAAANLAQRLVANGSDGLVVAGTTGEAPTLTEEEKIRLFSVITEAVGGKAMVIAGTGSYSTADSVRLTVAAEKTGVDGVMLVSPYYNKPTQEGLYQHFKTVATATKLPVIIYNIPGRTGVNIEAKTLVRLAKDVPNIVAVKEASGDLDQVAKIRRELPASFLIYSGEDHLTLPILSVGGHGVISVASHLVGMEIKEMCTLFHQGEVAKAREIHLKLWPLFKALFVRTNPIPVKTALNLLGFNVGGFRLPLCEAGEDELAPVKTELKALGLI